MRVYLQKTNATVCEFLRYDIISGKADPKTDLGDVGIKDGMSKNVLVAKLRDAADRIERHKGDIFVIQ